MIIEEAITWAINNPMLTVEYALTAIGTATVLFRSLATLTDTKADNRFFRKVLKFLERVSLNKDTGQLTIDVKRDTKE